MVNAQLFFLGALRTAAVCAWLQALVNEFISPRWGDRSGVL